MARLINTAIITPGQVPTRGLPRVSWGFQRQREFGYDGVPISPYLGNLLMLTQGYKDNGSGNYGGTADAVLVNPISWAAYLIQSNVYGDQSIVTPGTFGNFPDARAALNQWATWGHRTGAKNWTSFAVLQQQNDIESALVELTNHLPATRFTKDAANKYQAFVWTPGEAWPTSQLYNSGLPIDIELYLLANSEGADIAVWRDDSSDVVNEVRIKYHYDVGKNEFLRTAKLDRLGSDDGYGDAWGQWGGVAGKDIAEWSHGRYGQQPLEIELHDTSDPDIAVAHGQYHFWSRYRPPVNLQMRTLLGLVDLQPGHIFRLSSALESRLGLKPQFWGTATSGTYEHADWESIYWLCTYADTGGGPGFRARTIRASWLPRTFGNEVGAGAGASGEVGVAGSLSEEL